MKKVLLYQILVFTIHGKTKKADTKTINLSAPTRDDKFSLPGGSYSVSGIQDYFKYI